MYKTMEPVQTDRYPLKKEQELLTKVKEGNLKESSALLNDLLGYVFYRPATTWPLSNTARWSCAPCFPGLP